MALALLSLVAASGCIRYDMQEQPRLGKYRPAPESIFRDQIPGRPLVAGTIPRGYLHEDEALYTGKIAANKGKPGANPAYLEGEVYDFPFPITKEVLERGQDRYQIFCVMCHGLTGAGDGMVVQRGYKKPPSYLEDRVLSAPVGHEFDVITNGWGGMPSYAAQIPPRDRWAIISYVRALQVSGGAVPLPNGLMAMPAQANKPPETGGTKTSVEMQKNANQNTNGNANQNANQNANRNPNAKRAATPSGGGR